MAETAAVMMLVGGEEGVSGWGETYMPTMPTFLPGPQPNRFSGLKTVRPVTMESAQRFRPCRMEPLLTCTHHRRRNITLQLLRNRKHKLLMRPHMARPPALADRPIPIRRPVRVDAVRAVILLAGLAIRARHVALHLRADANTVALLAPLDLGPDLDRAADDLVAHAEWQGVVAPAAGEGVYVGAADAACVDGDVDVVVLEGLELELCGGKISSGSV